MSWIDTHAHLGYFSEEELASLLVRAQDAHIKAIVNIATSLSDLEKGLSIVKRTPWVFQTAGIPPHDAKNPEALHQVQSLYFYAKSGQLIAVGECGLDYYHGKETIEEQKVLFLSQIELAKEFSLPLIIHCRDAFSDLFKIADKNGFPEKVLIHCFTGDFAESAECVRRGWMLSFSGIITFEKSEALRQVVKNTPLDRLVIETDSPYLAPTPHRGQKNEPAYLVEVAKTVTEVRGISLDQLSLQLQKNVGVFFGLSIK